MSCFTGVGVMVRRTEDAVPPRRTILYDNSTCLPPLQGALATGRWPL